MLASAQISDLNNNCLALRFVYLNENMQFEVVKIFVLKPVYTYPLAGTFSHTITAAHFRY